MDNHWFRLGDHGRYPAYASMYRLLIAFLIFTGGCGSPESHQATSRTPGGWLQTDVAGRALVYRHENGEDRSQYSPDGELLVTIMLHDAPPCLPLMYWQIDSDGYLLQSTDESMAEPVKYKLLSRNENSLVVECKDKQIVLEYASGLAD